MLCKCHWIVLYTVHFTAFCLGGPLFSGHGVEMMMMYHIVLLWPLACEWDSIILWCCLLAAVIVVEWLCHVSLKHWVDYRVTLNQSCLH